jgi:hypothetical protein
MKCVIGLVVLTAFTMVGASQCLGNGPGCGGYRGSYIGNGSYGSSNNAWRGAGYGYRSNYGSYGANNTYGQNRGYGGYYGGGYSNGWGIAGPGMRW